MLLSDLRSACADEVDAEIDGSYDKDTWATIYLAATLDFSLANALLIVALTCGMVNAVICGTWWLVAILSIGYLPTVFLTYLILCAILMLKYTNSYRKK